MSVFGFPRTKTSVIISGKLKQAHKLVVQLGSIPAEVKDFFLSSSPLAISHFLTGANAQWEIREFTEHYNIRCRVNSLIHHLKVGPLYVL